MRGFGWLSVLETYVGLNRDRPELTSVVLLAPQLKVADKLRLRLNLPSCVRSRQVAP